MSHQFQCRVQSAMSSDLDTADEDMGRIGWSHAKHPATFAGIAAIMRPT